MNSVEIVDNGKALSDADHQRFSNIALQTLKFLAKDKNEVTIVFSDDHEIQHLNKQFAKNDYPTDVLSFSADQIDPETGLNYLGDIVISIGKAQIQAQENNIHLFEELTTLLIHGVLHLCGFDHADDNSENEMFALQKTIFDQIEGF